MTSLHLFAETVLCSLAQLGQTVCRPWPRYCKLQIRLATFNLFWVWVEIHGGGATFLTAVGLDLLTLTFREIKVFSAKPPKSYIYIYFLQGGQQQPRFCGFFFGTLSQPSKTGPKTGRLPEDAMAGAEVGALRLSGWR